MSDTTQYCMARKSHNWKSRSVYGGQNGLTFTSHCIPILWYTYVRTYVPTYVGLVNFHYVLVQFYSMNPFSPEYTHKSYAQNLSSMCRNLSKNVFMMYLHAYIRMYVHMYVHTYICTYILYVLCVTLGDGEERQTASEGKTKGKGPR